MSKPGANFDCFGDIFPYLTDELVSSEVISVESVIDSLYNYGLIHGDQIQGKVEKSPFYTKQYKRLTPKQQQMWRAEKIKQDAQSEDEDDSEEEIAKIPATKKGKNKSSAPAKEVSSAPILLNSGRTFIGVTFSSNSKDNKSPRGGKGGRGHKVVAESSSSQNPFEAVVTISNRKISLGLYPSVDVAAQAHDRALIRANGPTSYKQAGVLNYPLSFYASDSLSRFSVFDAILRKQLFGSDWSGPKPCDFGFLMTQMSAATTKRGADFSAMDGSERKKRHKGQYSDGDVSGNDFEFNSSTSSPYVTAGNGSKPKKLLYGNFYAPIGERAKLYKNPELAEAAEPYFKSPG